MAYKLKVIYTDTGDIKTIVDHNDDPIELFDIEEFELYHVLTPIFDICLITSNFLTITEVIERYGSYSTGFSLDTRYGNGGAKQLYVINRKAVEAKAKAYADTIKGNRKWHGLSHLITSTLPTDVSNSIRMCKYDTIHINYVYQKSTGDRFSFGLTKRLMEPLKKPSTAIYKYGLTLSAYRGKWQSLIYIINRALKRQKIPVIIGTSNNHNIVEVIKMVKRYGLTFDDIYKENPYGKCNTDKELYKKMFSRPSVYIIKQGK